FLAGEHSWYEDYIEKRALRQRLLTRSQRSPALLLDGYTPPQFTSYRDFWTTAEQQQGLADFSSRNFFSVGTNWACSKQPEPVCRQNAYTRQQTEFSLQTINKKTVSGRVTLFLGNVQDHLTGATIPNVALTSRSQWDQHLEKQGFFSRFTLNTLN